MYIIDKAQNRIKKLEQKSFTELGFKERQHLQEWLAYNPKSLGEELLIIQKEFDGFMDTNERLDLLAVDKTGNLVIIENKLDDTGRDVTWQVLKYASYCSTLTKDQIKNMYQQFLDRQDIKEDATNKLGDFFNQEYDEITLNQRQTQRIMMVAANFRKEVTSSALWLINYKLRIQCFKATPFAHGDQLFLTL
jgi:RecB family endonuclease NucS